MDGRTRAAELEQLFVRGMQGDQHAISVFETHLQQWMASSAPDDPSVSDFLWGLLTLLTGDGYRAPQLDRHLDRAITIARVTASHTPVDHRDRVMRVAIWGDLISARYERFNYLQDLDKAIEIYRSVVTIPAPHYITTLYTELLAEALQERNERVTSAADLDEAVDCLRRVELATRDRAQAQHRAITVSNLASALRQRFERDGQVEDLSAAVDFAREAAAAPDAESPQRTADRRSNLGNHLRRRFEATYRLEDLNDALRHLRAAVGIASAAGPETPKYTMNLAVALLVRYETLGQLADLDEARAGIQWALDHTPADHPQYAGRVHMGARVLWRLAEHAADYHRLTDNALGLAKRAVDATPPSHPAYPGRLSLLVSLLDDRAQATGGTEIRDEAIRLARLGYDAIGADRAVAGGLAPTLASLMFKRYAACAEDSDFAFGLEVTRLALQVAAPVEHAGLRHNLARAYAARFGAAGRGADRDEAISEARVVALSPAAPTRARLMAALLWARESAARGDSADAVEAYRVALENLTRLAIPGLRRADGERLLDEWRGIARDAAAEAILIGQLDTAVEFLEQGRGILWSQLLRQRSSLDELRDRHPELASELSSALRVLTIEHSADDDTGRNPRVRADVVAQSAERIDELTARIRTLPGFERFFGGVRINDISRAASGGPVAIINIAEKRCDAIIVTASGTELVALPDLTAEDVAQMAAQYLDTLQPRSNTFVQTVHEWLWRTTVRPVLDHLGFCTPAAPDAAPRIWWCPTGLMSQFPLHAAGTGERGCSALDRVVSSYTPTLRALAEARGRPAGSGATGLLSVAVPHTPALPEVPLVWADLPGVLAEVDHIDAVVGGEHHERIVGASATHAAVIAGLRAHRVTHFACHGITSYHYPSSSGLVLFDGVLPVTDIAGQRLSAECVYLSACDTHAPGTETIDEVVTLATALNYVGCRHVIAALSPIGDDAAVTVAGHVYRRLMRSGRLDLTDAARAVHAALLALRDADPGSPHNWAPYLHIGP